MWRNVRDLGAFIGVAIYAVSFASLFRLVRKPDADLPPRQIARPPLHAIKEDVESFLGGIMVRRKKRESQPE